MARSRRERLKQDLLNRQQETYEQKDSSGRFGDFFNEKMTLPKWVAKEGEHIIDIIPWEIGNNFPTRNYPNAKPGGGAHVLDLWVHNNVGPNEDQFICPARNYGRACPICEHTAELKKEDADDETVKATYPKRRTVYLIICRDSAEEEAKGLQVWQVAHFFMQKHLDEISKKPRGGGYVPFPDPDEGKQIFFKRAGSGATNTSYIAHQFLDREDYIIEDDILDKAPSLDECIHVPTYEELYAAYWGRDINEEKPTKPSAKKEETSEEVPYPSEEETQEEVAPRARRTRPTPEPEPVEKDEAPDNPCPSGGTFGIDCDKISGCQKCPEDLWQDCAKRQDEIEAEKKAGGGRRRRAANG